MDLLLMEGSGGLRVISVWGSRDGDLGMTSIVWDAYTAKRTCDNFTCRAWVKLRRPFNPHEFVRSLTAQFFANTCEQQAGSIVALDVLEKMEATATQRDLHAEFKQHVNEKRFLIVLEDLSTMEEWNAITTFFPKGKNNGSCIIVSTLHFEVARLSVGHPYRFLHLNQLPAQHSVYAFYKLDGPVASNSCKKDAAKKWVEQHPLVGRDSVINDLNKHASFAALNCRKVMSVWGVAGVGKSALLKHVFCDKILKCNSRLYTNYAWVDLSHPFNLWDFSRSLLLSFASKDIQAKGAAEICAVGSENPIVKCREILHREQCLIVIDGLQSTKEWDLIQAELLSTSNPKTFIFVIASEESIATHCRGAKGPLKYNVKGLEPEAAYRLFCKVSTKEQLLNDVEAAPVKAMLQDLVSKCGGLPKVIGEIAGLMAAKKVGWKEQADSINNNFVQELKSSEEFAKLKNLFGWMQSYFCNCPDFLKPCIFYLSIFSPNQHIRRRRLVRRWIAEGYSRDSHEESADENGEKQFLNLVSLSIIQQPFSVGLGGTKTISCQVNGFFREYIISQRLEENLVFELDGSCTVSTQRTERHLVISESWDRDKIVFESIDFSRLRSLTVLGKWESFFISENMKLLRVLDLEDARGVNYSDLQKIVKCFSRLKFISLRGCKEICHLPSSVGDLRQLQTLDVRHTSIVTLPDNITKLQSLQYIRAGTAAITDQHEPSNPHLWFPGSNSCRRHHLVGVKIPAGIGNLTPLHTLGVVNVNASGTKATLEDLKKLTQLRKLGVSGINKNNSEKFFSAISFLVHLESLSVRLDKNNQNCLKDITLPLESLPSLKIHGLGEKLPPWSQKLTKLTKIDIQMDKMLKPQEGTAMEDVMMFLGTLPELCILRVSAKEFEDNKLNVRVNKNGLEDDSYKKVKIFHIAGSSTSDVEVTFGSKTMKKLEQLKVDCSNESKYQFSCLINLRDLKEVCLKGPYANTQKGYVERLLKEHQNSPVVKLEQLPM